MTKNLRIGSFLQRIINVLNARLGSRVSRGISGTSIFVWTTLLSLIVLTTFGINILTARQALIEDAIGDARTLADLAENRMTNALNTTSTSLSVIAETLRLNHDRPEDHAFNLELMKTERRRLLPYQTYILVTDATGKISYRASRTISQIDNISDREYFGYHRDNESRDNHLGLPFKSDFTGHDVFTLSRRLVDDRGQFAGVVVCAFDVPVFEKQYGAFKKDYGGSVIIMRNDGIVLARGPHIDGLVGTFNKPLFNNLQNGEAKGSIRRMGNAEYIPLIISYRKLEAEGVTVAVGLDENQMLTTWRYQSLIYGLVACALLFSLFWVSLNFYAALQRDRRLTRELTEKKEQLNGIVTSAMDAIITTDESQTIVLFNEAAEKMFGYRGVDAIGQPIDILIPDAHRENHRKLVKAFGESGVTSRMMGSLGLVSGRRSTGIEFPAEAAISQLKSDDQKFYTVILRDISARVRAFEEIAKSRAELELRVKERTAALERSQEKVQSFNYAVSHDLRAPVRHISGFAELALLEVPAADDVVKNYLHKIIQATHRMDGIIQGLLRLAQTNSAQIKVLPVKLAELISSVTFECTPASWTGKLDIDARSLPVVLGDELLLHQLFVNLISNAFKYTSKTPQPVIEIHGYQEKQDEVIISVRDNGAGFDMQYVSKLFTPLQRLHRHEEFEGTGIGLASAKNIVELHGGKIWAKSMPGRGATFFVALKVGAEIKINGSSQK